MADRYVSKHPQGWAVRAANESRASSIHRTQREAEAKARSIVRSLGGGEVRIQGLDGKWRDSESPVRRSIPALKVRQWKADWNEIGWKPKEHRSEPPRWFFQFSIRATELKALSGVYRRTTERISAADDLGIQRRHEVERSREISRFVRFGYPWSNLSVAKRTSSEFGDLRQPGWLPTAIVVNILTPDQKRNGTCVSPGDLIDIKDGDPATLLLPANFRDDHWRFQSIPPIEVIDGQHRLWAFEDDDSADDFEVPVVAFHGLDLSWQAYLFYTINIKPKRINPSIAFDLYPLLRTEEWLSKSEGHPIYRESRAQELVDILWWYPGSPWYHRINMLGEPGQSGLQVTQAAWVRSLMASFIKLWEGKRVRIGGLFGTFVGRQKTVLPWSRRQQAAFVILVGSALRDAIAACDDAWAVALREAGSTSDGRDPAFIGRKNLLNQDQGVRVFLQTVNDLHFVCADDLELDRLRCEEDPDASDEQAITAMLDCFRRMEKLNCFLNQFAEQAATYDWRSSRAPGLTEDQQVLKAGFRGSGGYRGLREHILRHLVASDAAQVSKATKQVLTGLGY